MAKTKPRYVLDTNVLVSALLFEGSKPGQAVRRALRIGIVLASTDTLDELARVLEREKFSRYITREERDAFLAALVKRVELVEPTVSVRVCRDPDDDKFLELAVAGEADLLVSSDRDLLDLHPFRTIAILTPAEFLEQEGKHSPR